MRINGRLNDDDKERGGEGDGAMVMYRCVVGVVCRCHLRAASMASFKKSKGNMERGGKGDRGNWERMTTV